MADAGWTTKGADENQRKDQIHQQIRYYNGLYGNKLPKFPLATQEFKLTVLRPDYGDAPDITGLMETCEWRDEGEFDNLNSIPVLRGTIQLRKPHPDGPHAAIDIHDGHVIRCQVNWGGRWKEVWQMRIQKTSVSIADGAWTFECADDLQLISMSMYDFKYVAGDSQRKKGYRYWEIVRLICKQANLPLDRAMPKGERWIKDFNQSDVNPLEAIRQVVEMEEAWTGMPHHIYWRDGKLHIKMLRRNPLLFTFSDQIRGGDISVSRKSMVYTAMTGVGSGKGTSKKDAAGKDGKKKTETKDWDITIVDKKAVEKYGYIHGILKLGSEIDSREEAKRLILQKIKESVLPLQVVEGFSHYGIAFVRRGDGVRVSIPSEGLSGIDGFLFCYSVTHTLSASDYTMTLSLTTNINDPLNPNKIAETVAAAKRLRKREKNKGKDDSASSDSAGSGKGKVVGASYYSGTPGYKGDDLNAQLAYAELGGTTEETCTNLGGLPYKHALRISYKGKSVVAKKLDIGLGGDDVQGHRRDIDLHVKVADALGFTPAGVDLVTIEDA